MSRFATQTKHAPAGNRRMPSLDEWRARGGVMGEVRRIILQWRYPFTARAITAAFTAEWPTLSPCGRQIRDILDMMADRGQITRLTDGRFDPRAKPPERKPAVFRRRPVTRPKQIQLAL